MSEPSIEEVRVGPFAPNFNPAFRPVGRPARFQLDFDGTVDDHDRPQPPPGENMLWRRYAYPETQVGLLLFKDGRVVRVASIIGWEASGADDVVAAGYVWKGNETDWQYQVLLEAGYSFIEIGAA